MLTYEQVEAKFGKIAPEWMERELTTAQVLEESGTKGLLVDTVRWDECVDHLRAKLEQQTELFQGLVEQKIPNHKPVKITSRAELGKLIYDELRLISVARATETGARSVSKDALISVESNPLIQALQAAQHTRSELSFAESAEKWLRPGQDGRFCTLPSVYDCISAPTGRIYCSDFNVMQLPHIMRSAVVASPGKQLFFMDYTGQEFRIICSVAQELKMLDAMRQGLDIHVKAAAAAFRIPESEVTKEQRNVGKIVNYGLLYGGTDYTLCQKIQGLSSSDAKSIIRNYFTEYVNIKTWQDRTKAAAYKGFIVNPFGYTRQYSSEGRQSLWENIALNTVGQSSGACVLKYAISNLSKIGARVLTCVHDSVLAEFDPAQLSQAQLEEATIFRREGWIDIAGKARVGAEWEPFLLQTT